ncbi:MAG: transposase [Phycisphaerales bacterium]|nr:transposase [Phycisphaerales bacterium]
MTFTCHGRLPLLSKDRTREWLVDSLDRARRILALKLWAYVIMPEHVHVLFLPTRPDYRMSAILKVIKQPVGQKALNFLKEFHPSWLARMRVPSSGGQPEHGFWQPGGGYDRNIDRARTAWNCVQYIHNNPVRRGLAACPSDWEWSSARWYEGRSDVRLAMDEAPPDSPI